MKTGVEAAPTPPGRRALRRIERFFFAPAGPEPLAVLRIGLAATLLAQALQLAPALRALYHSGGLVPTPLAEVFGPRHLPPLGGLLPRLGGPAESAILTGLGVLYLASLAGMLVGWRTRAVTAAAWLIHLFFVLLSPLTSYAVDDFASIFLFYAMWAPGSGVLSLDRRAGRATGSPTEANRLALRVMQLHLCIAYFLSGVAKARGEQWWNGEAIWRALTGQGYQLLDFTWLATVPALAMLAGYIVLVIEIGYPLFVWPRATRRLWVVAVAAMHAGIGLFMGLHVFAALMIVLTVAAFGVSAEPARGRGTATA